MADIRNLSDDQFLSLIQPEDAVARQRMAADAEQRADHLASLDTLPDPQAAQANVFKGGDDAAAQDAYALGRKLRLPPALVKSDPEFYKNLQRATETGSLWAEAPATAQFYSNSERAEMAYRDAPQMARAEKWVRSIPASVTAGVGSLEYGIGETFAALDRIQQDALNKVNQIGENVLGKERNAEFQGFLRSMDAAVATYVPTDQELIPHIISGGKSTKKFANVVAGFDLDDPRQNDLFTNTVRFFGEMAPALVVSAFFPEAAPYLIGAQGVGAQAERLDRQGKLGQSFQSDLGLIVGGAVTGYLGKFGITRYLEELPAGVRNSVLRRTADLLATGTYEVGVDVGQTLAGEAVFSTANNEVFRPFPNGITEQELPVFLASLLIRGGVQVLDPRIGAFSDVRNIQEGFEQARSVEDLVDANRQIKFRQKAPEEYEKFLKQAGFDQKDIYIDRDALAEVVDAPGAEGRPEVAMLREQLSRQHGDKIRISGTDFITQLADTDTYSTLKDAITQTPRSTSPAAAEASGLERMRAAFGEQARQAEETIKADKGANDAAKRVADSLVATGRVSPSLAKGMGTVAAAYARSMAERRGVPISEVLSGLTIKGPGQGEGLAQAAFHGGRKVFRYDDSKPSGSIGVRKPQGLYTTFERESPHSDQGALNVYETNPDAKVLVLDASDLISSNRGDFVGQPAGIAALAHFIGWEKTNEMLKENTETAKATFHKKFPELDVSLYTDTHDVVDAYGAALARENGFDAIQAEDKATPEFNEYVGLTDAAFLQNRAVFDPDSFFDFGDAAAPPVAANTDSPAFKAWFGDSAVVDADGRPLPVYHGTAGEFAHFAAGASVTGHASAALGFFTTESRERAQHYAENASGGVPAEENVLALYASIQEPYHMSLEEAQRFENGEQAAARKRELIEQGYDGIKLGDDTWVAFDPEQLKSTDNQGTWSRKSSNILEQKAKEVRGWYSPDQVLIRLTNASDETTFLHEFAHYMRHQMEAFNDQEFLGAVNGWHAREAKSLAKEATKYAKEAAAEAKKVGLKAAKLTITEADAQKYFSEGTTGSRVKDAMLYKAGQEQFARGFETYLMEGKAPSMELRSVFRRLAAIFRRIYRSLGGNLRVNLDPSARNIYSKLLATEDQIDSMSRSGKYQDLFTDATMAGMSEKQWAEYQAAKAEQDGKAAESAREKWMNRIKRLLTKDWAQERGDLIEEILPKVQQEKVHVVTERIKNELPLDRAAVKEMVGETRTSKLGKQYVSVPAKLAGMTKTGGEGLHPDQAAEMLGYGSGRELLNALLKRDTPLQEAKRKAEAELERRHSEELSEESLGEMADEALSNEGYAKKLMAEIKALGNNEPRPAKAMKQIAEEEIGKLKYNEIHPGVYRKGQTRAAKDAAEALAAGDKEAAREAKQRQQVQFYLEQAARKARETVEKRLKDLKRYDTKSVRAAIAKPGGGHLEQLDALLARFELRKSLSLTKHKEALAEWARHRTLDEGDQFALSPEVLNEGFKKHWREMTLDELNGVFDSAKSIEHTARFANKVRLAEETVEYESAIQKLVAQVDELPAKYKPSRAGDNTVDRGGPIRNVAADIARALHIPGAVAQLTKIPFLVKYLDHGELAGYAQELLVQPFTDAHFNENVLHGQTSKLVSDAIKGRGEEFHVRMAKKYDIEGVDTPVLGWGALMYALNTGTESNLRVMLLGERWANTDAEVSDQNPTLRKVLSVLTKEDWDLVELIWEQMDILYPRMVEVRRAQTGVTPPKIEPRTVRTQFGERQGGYFPLKPDYERARFLDADQKMDLEKEHASEVESLFDPTRFYAPEVTTSATKERTGRVYPIDLNPARISTHFSSVVHYITHHDAVRQVHRLTNDARFQRAVTQAMGPENYRLFSPWIKDVAQLGREQGPVNFVGKILGHFQTGATLTYLGYRLSTLMMQFAGVNTSAAEVGGRYLLKGMHMSLTGVRKNQEALEWATAHSKILSSRIKEMDREMYRAYKEINSGVVTLGGKTLHLSGKKYLQRYELASMKLIGLVQLRSVDLPTWYAGYFKEMDSSGDEARAFRAADRAVENSQGSGRVAEGAAIMRDKNPLLRIFTMFMTWFSSVTNQQIGIARDFSSGKADPIELASRAGWVFLAGPILDMAFHGQLWPHDEEDDDTLKGDFIRNAIGYNIAGIPLIRDAVSYLVEGYSYRLSPVEALVEKGLRGVKNVSTAPFTGREPTLADYKGLSEGFATALHIPGTAQAWDTGEALYQWLKEGEDIGFKEIIFGPEYEK